MSQDNIRVLVVDDSAVIRAIICDQIGAAPGLSVAGKARDGRDALEKIASLRPDVVTLDLQMPGMDGLEVLDAMLASDPIPVIMVSSATCAGATVTLDALDRGAVDYVAKPDNAARRSGGIRGRTDFQDSRRGGHRRSPHDGLRGRGDRRWPGCWSGRSSSRRPTPVPPNWPTSASRWAYRRADRRR